MGEYTSCKIIDADESTLTFKVPNNKWRVEIPKPPKDSPFAVFTIETPNNINLWQRMWMRFIGWQVTKL